MHAGTVVMAECVVWIVMEMATLTMWPLLSVLLEAPSPTALRWAFYRTILYIVIAYALHG